LISGSHGTIASSSISVYISVDSKTDIAGASLLLTAVSALVIESW
jgi:hypothetical protein